MQLPSPKSKNFISPDFMLPSISLENKFWHALNSSHCSCATLKLKEKFSENGVALEGEKVLLSYLLGHRRMKWRVVSWSLHKLYYLELCWGHSCESRSHNVDYANANGNYVAWRHFKTRYKHIRGRECYVVLRRCFKVKLHAMRRRVESMCWEILQSQTYVV